MSLDLGNRTFAGNVEVLGTFSGPSVLNRSTASIILAVSTSGNDTDPNRPAAIVGGDWSAYPFATIQAAIDSLPSQAVKDHDIIINVGAGTFPGFALQGFLATGGAASGYVIQIVGTRAPATPTTGPGSGTATSGSNRTLVLTGAGWTPDDLVGRFVNVTAGTGAGQIRLIGKNTADTITFATTATPNLDATSQFTIEDLATVIGNPAPPAQFYTVVLRTLPTGRIQLADLAIEADGVGVLGAFYFDYLSLYRVVGRHVSGTVSGLVMTNGRSLYTNNCGAIGPLRVGFSTQNLQLWLGSMFAMGATNTGWNVNNQGGWSFMSSAVYVRDIGVYGVAVDRSPIWAYDLLVENCPTGLWSRESFVDLRGAKFDNCTNPFVMVFTGLRLYGGLSGSGNTNFGLNAKGTGNTVQLEGFTPTITGGLGDASVDGVANVPWSSLSAVGDYALDMATGARINRQ